MLITLSSQSGGAVQRSRCTHESDQVLESSLRTRLRAQQTFPASSTSALGGPFAHDLLAFGRLDVDGDALLALEDVHAG